MHTTAAARRACRAYPTRPCGEVKRPAARVDGALQRAVGPVPGADVDRGCGDAEQHDQEGEKENDDLAGLARAEWRARSRAMRLEGRHCDSFPSSAGAAASAIPRESASPDTAAGGYPDGRYSPMLGPRQGPDGRGGTAPELSHVRPVLHPLTPTAAHPPISPPAPFEGR